MQNKAFSMEDLFAFLNAGVSAFHSTAAAAAILEAEGYRNCPESAAWHLVPGGKYYTTRNGSAILAWRMPKGPLTGWHAAASHSDSPTWRIKTLDGADHGFARAEVEGYGGMLMSTWFDRPLSVAGRLLVRTADGVESRLVHPERALACIPNLCIHFNREANTGLNYESDAIAACVIGGVSFVGGIGKIRGIVIGVLMLRLIFVGLNMIGINQDLFYIIKGGIILFACALDMRKYLVKK
mgnify:CR=1 FL=1